MKNKNEELKLEAIQVIADYTNGDPDVSDKMACMAARILLACQE